MLLFLIFLIHYVFLLWIFSEKDPFENIQHLVCVSSYIRTESFNKIYPALNTPTLSWWYTVWVIHRVGYTLCGLNTVWVSSKARRACCVMLLVKTLCYRSTSVRPGVQMCAGEFKALGKLLLLSHLRRSWGTPCHFMLRKVETNAGLMPSH